LIGRLSATLQATTDLAEPAATARGTLRVDSFDGQWNQLPFGLVMPAAFAFGGQRVQVQQLALAAQGSTVQVTGELPMTAAAGEGELDVQARLDLATLVGYVPDARLRANGTAAVTGHIRGTLTAIDPELTLSVDKAELSSDTVKPGISNLTLRAAVNHGEAVVEQLTANWGTAMIEASARVPLALVPPLPVEIPREAGAAMLKASVTGLDVATIPGAPAGLTGRITAQADGEGTSVTDLRGVTGQLTFSELELGFRTVSLAQDQPATVALSDGVATIERLRLAGSAGMLTASGRVGLTGERTIDARADGNVDLAVLSIVTDAVRASGPVTLALAAGGTISQPDLNGTIDLADGAMTLDEPRIAADNLTAHVALAGSRISLDSLSGQLNGGTLEASGTAVLADGSLADVDLKAATRGFAFDAPLELRSLSDSDLRLHKVGDEFVVDGKVTISDAGLTGDINFDTGLLAAVTARRQLDLTESRNPLLERVRFNVNVVTTEPILLDNNLAKAEVTGDVRVLGTPYETGLTGRLTLEQGGQLTLNERQYLVERGLITFLDERRIQPSFDLELNTTVNPYEITLTVSGMPGETDTTLTASPMLPEPDIMALLVTGRTLDDMRGEEGDVAREQILSYLAGRIGSTLGRGIEKATGLSEVRIEPNLIANETDPSARLTVGQDLSDEFRLVYSTNLTDSSDQIWVAQYDVTRRFQTRAVRQSDGSYRGDFRHDVRFGGHPEPRRERREPLTVGTIRISGTTGTDEADVRSHLRATEGESYDYFAVRRGVERIERAYLERGYLQAKVRISRMRTDDEINLDVRITPGPPVTLQFTGAMPPSKIQDRVREQWRRGVFDAQRIDDGARVLQEWLQSERHLQAKVHGMVQEQGARRAVTFAVEPGPQSEKIVLAFEGAQAVDPDVLQKIIDEQELEPKLFTDPLVVTELLRRYYREQAYLSAKVDTPRVEFDGPIARVVLMITEGPHFVTKAVTVTGNRVYDSAQLTAELPLVAGDSFLPAVAERSLDHIRDVYWRRGYNDVRSDYDLIINRDTGEVQVTFRITEGLQTVVAGIDVTGNHKIREQLVREELQVTPQQPLDLAALGRSRKALYDVGAFSIVDITREPVTSADASGTPAAVPTSDGAPAPKASTDSAPAAKASTGGAAEADATKPVEVHVNVREVQPIQIGYGASYDTERGAGGIFDIANYNSLGRGRVIGLRSRYDGQVREVRGYLSQPSWRDWPVKTTASIYYREDRAPETTLTRGFVFDRRGVSVQQEKELRNAYVWTYGVRYERVRTFTGELDNPESEVTVSPFTSTFTREQRDDVLDASRGSFTSNAFSVSPPWLGVDGAYIKYFGQYFHYIPLQRVRRKPLTNELLRPRLVFATGVRVGLADGLGGRPVPLAERFFAGGSTTLRGFEQNTVGPISLTRVPLGGEAMLVLNNEIRVPLVSIVDGVGFVDIGNVFPNVRDFSFTDLRQSAGIGLRVRTPWFLVRGDLGFPLDRRPGEPRSRFFFSIGQAF
jgi:outer membrane protein insertion porin family